MEPDPPAALTAQGRRTFTQGTIPELRERSRARFGDLNIAALTFDMVFHTVCKVEMGGECRDLPPYSPRTKPGT